MVMTRLQPGWGQSITGWIPRMISGLARGQVGRAVRLAEVRLRVPIVLVIAAVVVGRWDVIRNHWDRLTRRAPAESVAGRAVSSDTEYFCPMDPGVVSDWPGRCGVCNMALVRRRRGEAVMLPEGILARMQLSPYRIQLAGIQTATVDYRPLEREWTASGVVARQHDTATILVAIPTRQAPWVDEGQMVEVACADLPGHDPIPGRVRAVERREEGGWESARVTVAMGDPPPELRGGMIATVRFRAAMAALEPFRSMPHDPPPVLPGEPRSGYVCPDHSETLAIEPGRCPIDGNETEPRPLGAQERIQWWCPMHPAVTARKAGAVCRQCGGMALRPRVMAYAPAGQVLAVPQSAVVDTGDRKTVFVESMPGMFDGVEVVLGPRCGDFYPTIRGLEAGQRVATAGAFLLDAETRLNPSLAAGYFGAGRGDRPAVTAPPRSPVEGAAGAVAARTEALRGLTPEDRRLAEAQELCPVTGMPLGSMGTPQRRVVSGRVVFLCCEGCEPKLLREPAKYLARLSQP
jgi:hypothetical protein